MENHNMHTGHGMPGGTGPPPMAGMGHMSAPANSTGAAMKMSGHAHYDMAADFRRRFWVCLILTIPILALSPAIQNWLGFGDALKFSGDSYVLFALSTAVYLYGGFPFLKGIVTELGRRSPGMMTLIAVAITVAYVYSSAVVFGFPGSVFFWELATLIDVMLLGHWLEMKSIAAASSALEQLARLLPARAHKVMPDGNTVDIALSELKAGDRVLVKPGEKVPADGVVIEGATSVNESMLTGESVPMLKEVNSQAIGGSVNGEGSITLEVKKTGSDSYLSQVARLVREAQASKSHTQGLADRAALVLVLVALGGGALTLLIWIGPAGKDFLFGLTRMVTVMVIACPHALGLAIPLVVAVSTSLSARNGILIKDREGFEKARNVNAVVFDKTGTLTLGQFGVTGVFTLDGSVSKDDVLSYAASVEQHSEHPIAYGIVGASKLRHKVEGFKSIPGKGAGGKVKGKEVVVASPGYLKELGLAFPEKSLKKEDLKGRTVVFVIIDGRLSGTIILSDIIRPESVEAIEALKMMGVKPIMLTGDSREVAEAVSRQLGIDEYFAGVLPDNKAGKVKEIQSSGLRVAVVGDGVNDAPALAQADVGIAIGAGTDVAVATADVVLVKSNPKDVVTVINLSRATYGKMVQNLAWATGYNVIALPLAAGIAYGVGVLLDPAVGAALMALSTVIVAVNARFLKISR
jgi:Cu2+-exporting ATPase